MATTLADIQTAVAQLYEQGTAPNTTDEDYTLRTGIANRSIKFWESQPGIEWQTLWTTYSYTSAAETQKALPSNFRRAGGFVRITTAGTSTTVLVPLIRTEDTQLYSGSSERLAYITGDQSSGFYLNFTVAPSSGDTVKLDYYKYATLLSGSTDKPEMPDTDYIVHYVVAELHKGDKDYSAFASSRDDAQQILSAMVLNNAVSPRHQGGGIPDLEQQSGVGFGV